MDSDVTGASGGLDLTIGIAVAESVVTISRLAAVEIFDILPLMEISPEVVV